MNQNFQFNPMMDQMYDMPSTSPLVSNSNTLDLYGPYEGFIKGNLFKDLYEEYKNHSPAKLTPSSEKEELLLNLDQITFAAHELNLYLDINPNDRFALAEFNRYRKMSLTATEEYEKLYGPISLLSDSLETDPWAWENKMWPWGKESK